MANSLRDVKTRIASTKSTAQTTKAMYMVSQSKVRKAEKTYRNYQPFMKEVTSMVKSVLSKVDSEYVHPLMNEREVKKTCYLTITSDRGLAGGYNSSINKTLDQLINQNHKSKEEFVVASIGRKGYGYIKTKGYPSLNSSPIFVRDDVMFLDIVPLTKAIIKMYLEGEIDKLVIIYNHYINSISQEVCTTTLLPVLNVEGEISPIDYVYEVGVIQTLDLLLPMYIEDTIFGIILDAKTCEHCSRMNAMRSASDNADEIIAKLQLLYNRARQEVITNELIDIIGGANAIGGNE